MKGENQERRERFMKDGR